MGAIVAAISTEELATRFEVWILAMLRLAKLVHEIRDLVVMTTMPDQPDVPSVMVWRPDFDSVARSDSK